MIAGLELFLMILGIGLVVAALLVFFKFISADLSLGQWRCVFGHKRARPLPTDPNGFYAEYYIVVCERRACHGRQNAVWVIK